MSASETETGAVAEDGGITATVRERYGKAALRVASGEAASCCGPTCCGRLRDGGPRDRREPDYVQLVRGGRDRHTAPRSGPGLPRCGNPTALATLRPGEVVLDLGSGGGIDVLLSAKRVGPTGKAYGLDMTDEMLALAERTSARQACERRVPEGGDRGMPLPEHSVDVIISNCVINLSGDKRRVLAEAFRVLKPGGRFAVSDVVVRGDIPAAVKESLQLWVGCIAGALREDEFLSLLTDVGFVNASIEPTRVYELEDARAFLAGAGLDAEVVAREVSGRILSAFVRAEKPQVAS